MASEKIIKINTIEQFTELYKFPPTRHPLLYIARLETEGENEMPFGQAVQYNFYSIVIKQGDTCTSKYGWREYDFTKGLMNFFAPGQLHLAEQRADHGNTKGWMLLFHSDFVRKYSLGTKLSRYKFFSYETNEALHVSDEERVLVEGLISNMYGEYHRSIDEHTQDIIVSQLDVLLNYAERFYTRQFRTRNSVESDILARVESILHKHFEEDKDKLITANDIASQLSMSTHYLSDLLRNLTGMNTQQHIHTHLIEKAKSLLQTTNLSVNEIAYVLGFDYPQYFSRLFKRKTGKTPVEFRNMN